MLSYFLLLLFPIIRPLINDISFKIAENQTTAIVGLSGSGKTTLLKILLGFYKPTNGTIKLNDKLLNDFDIKKWRENCGVVFQDGYVFSNTFKNNIIMGKHFDETFFYQCVKMANLDEVLQTLPLGIETPIGANGIGLSQGQKQRVMIARALYKDPKYLFFDEATSALDAQTESSIVDSLNKYSKNRTVFVIAHRLSTVKNADNILVLEQGFITEEGSHNSLIEHKGTYYNLIKNQLDLE